MHFTVLILAFLQLISSVSLSIATTTTATTTATSSSSATTTSEKIYSKDGNGEEEKKENNDDDDESSSASTTRSSYLPNIVMIVMDDLGSHDLGLHGSGIHTPNIDEFVTGSSFAENNNGMDGIYLEEYYVLPYCSPTRSALMSGMYPLRTGVHAVIAPRSTAGLPLGIETLPEMLKRASSSTTSSTASDTYKTHAVGKWHIGHSSWNQTPTFRGFDSFYGFYIGGEDYFTHASLGGVDLHHDKQPNCGEGCSEVVNERGNYSTHVFTREAIEVIQNHHAAANVAEESSSSSSPLFLYLAYQAVHCPNEVPKKYMEPYLNKTKDGWSDHRINYAGMLSAADEGIGQVVDALKRTNMWNDTLIIFTTDNGGPTTVGCVQGSSNYPKRGGKCSLWEGGTTGDALLSGPALSKLLFQTYKKKNIKNKDDETTIKKNTNSNDGDDDRRYKNSEDVEALFMRKLGSSNNETTKSQQQQPKQQQKPLDRHRRFRHLFHVVDWFPTIAEWVNVVPRDQKKLDGISQVDALLSSSLVVGSSSISNDSHDIATKKFESLPARTELFGGYASCRDHPGTDNRWWGPSLRHLNWKIIQGVSGGPDGRTKYPKGTSEIMTPGNTTATEKENGINSKKYLLFDLEKDPREENDIGDMYPDVLRSMIYKLKLYRDKFTYPQINDDSQCPFPGFVNTTTAGPAWIPWCKDLQESILELQKT